MGICICTLWSANNTTKIPVWYINCGYLSSLESEDSMISELSHISILIGSELRGVEETILEDVPFPFGVLGENIKVSSLVSSISNLKCIDALESLDIVLSNIEVELTLIVDPIDNSMAVAGHNRPCLSMKSLRNRTVKYNLNNKLTVTNCSHITYLYLYTLK